MKSKDELRELDVKSHPELKPVEKETTLNFPNDTERGKIHTDVASVIKWVLSIEESVINNHVIKDGAIVSIQATIPKGVIKLQSSSRKSNAHSSMVSYGPAQVN